MTRHLCLNQGRLLNLDTETTSTRTGKVEFRYCFPLKLRKLNTVTGISYSRSSYKFRVSAMDLQVDSFTWPFFPLLPEPFILPKRVSSYFKTSSIRSISSSGVQLVPLFLLKLVSFTVWISTSSIILEINKADDNIHLIRNNYNTLYILFPFAFHKTA